MTDGRVYLLHIRDTAAMNELPPHVIDAEVVHHGVLRLTFSDGLVRDVSVLERMHGPVFERARSVAGFGEVRVDHDAGTVVWPGDVDLAPDSLYLRARSGTWPAAFA